MDDILNAGLSNQNELNTNPDLDNKPEVTYSDFGKKVSVDRPVNPMGAFDTSTVTNPLAPTIDMKDYLRYTSSDAFPKIGINPSLSQQQLERQFDANQSYGEAFGNMVGKFWNKTSDSFTDFFRADFTTNDQLIKHMYDELKDEQTYDLYNPSFDSRSDETRESFLQWLPGFDGSLDNYEQFLPNLGYTAGMMGAGIVQNFITGKALTGLGAIAGVAETAYEGNKLMDLITGMKNFNTGYKALKTINQGNSLIKGLQAGLEGYSMWSAFQSEAAMEGASTGQSTYEYLVDQYKQRTGVLPVGEDLEKIKATAYNAAKDDYWMNAPILLTSNFIQFSRALMPTGAKMLSEATEEAMKGYKLEGDIMKGTIQAVKEKPFVELWKEAGALDRVKISAQAIGGALKPMKGTLSEGMEESLQRFSSTLSQDVAIQKYQKGKADYWDATKYSVLDMLSKEGLQEFIGGAIIGMGTSMIGKASDISGLSDKFAKATGSETVADRNRRTESMRTNLVDVLNKSGVSFMMKDSGFLNTMREVLLSKDVVNYNNENNLFEAGIAKHLGLYNGVWNAMHSGKIDFVKEQYKSFGNNVDLKWLADELKVPLEDINKDNLKQITNSVINKIDSIKDSFKAVENHFLNSGIEKRILGKYDQVLKEAKKIENDIKEKYDIPVEDTDINAHFDKMEEADINLYKNKLGEIQDLNIQHQSFKEAVKVAAIAYQGMIDSRDKSRQLLDELNSNKAGINYTDASKFMNVNALRELKSSVETSLDLATEPRDKKKFKNQLEIIDKALALHYEEKNGKKVRLNEEELNEDELSQLMHEYAKSNKYEFDWLNNYMDVSAFENTSNYLNKLKDVIRHQKRSRQNLDIYNFLFSIPNFEQYIERNKTKIEEFIEKVLVWNFELQFGKITEGLAPEEETKEEEEKKEEKPEEKETKPTGYAGMVQVVSDDIQKEIEKNEGKNSPYNIEILMDNDGKHYVKATYSNPIYGRGEVTGDEKTAIDLKYADLINRLDEEEKQAREKKEINAKADEIASRFETRFNALEPDASKESIEDLLKELDEETSKLTKKKVPSSIEEIRKKINDLLLNLPEDYYVEGQKNNTYVPDEVLRERNQAFVGIEQVAYVTSLKTSSQDTEEDPTNEGLEALKKDDRSVFERNFKIALPNFLYRFYSEKNPNGIYRFVMVESTPELQQEAFGNYYGPGEVLLLQIKSGNEWKNAYVNEEQMDDISDNPSNGKLVLISFNDPNGDVFQKDMASIIQQEKGLRSYTEAMELFHQEDELNKRLREVSKTEPVPVSVDFVSEGVIMNSGNKNATTPVRDAFGTNMTTDLVIASGPRATAGDKLPTVFIGGREFPVGSTVLRNAQGDYIRIYPNDIKDAVIKVKGKEEKVIDLVDNIMSHSFYHEPGARLSDEIRSAILYLSTFVYTSKDSRYFRFDPKSRTIKLYDAKEKKYYDTLSDYTKTHKVRLNVSSSQINTPVKYTVTKDSNGKETITQELYDTEDYINFIIDNSFVKGSFENGTPIYVSQYFGFSPIVEENINQNTVPLEVIENKRETMKKLEEALKKREVNKEYKQAFTDANKGVITTEERNAIALRIDQELGITDLLNELRAIEETIKKYESGELKPEVKNTDAQERKDQFEKTYEISVEDSLELSDLSTVLNNYGLRDDFKFIESILAKNNVKVSFTGKHHGSLPKLASLDLAIIDGKMSLILTINKKKFDKLKQENKLATIAHEFVHGLIKIRLNEEGKLNNRQEFYKGLNDIFSGVREIFTSTRPEDIKLLKNFTAAQVRQLKEKVDYIEDNIEEFATLGLTDPNFSKLLKLMEGKTTKTEKTSLWSMLSDLVSKFLGIEKSKFNDLLNYLSDNLPTDINFTDQNGFGSTEQVVPTGNAGVSSEAEDVILNDLLERFKKDSLSIYNFTAEETAIWQKPENQTKIADFKTANGIFDNPFNDILGGAFRSKEEEEEVINSKVEEMDDEEKNYLKNIADKAGLQMLFKAANSRYWGQMTTAAVILYGNAKKGTGYHESFHVFTQMFLTKEQKMKLYSEVIEKEPRFKNHNLDNLKDVLDIEEFLADDFMNYMTTGKSELLNKTPVKKTIFQKIIDFLKSLFVNKVNLEKIYSDLRIGNLYGYGKPSSSNALFGKLNYAKGLEHLSYDKLNKYSRHADAEIGRIVSQPLTSVSGKYEGLVLTQSRAISTILDNPDLVKIVKNELYERFRVLGENATNPLVKEEIAYILSSWESFIKYNSDYSLNSYSLSDDYEDEDDEEKNNEDTRERVYDARPDEEKPSYMGKKIAKQLVLLCPKCKWNNATDTYEVITDEDGIIEPSSFDTLWTNIISQLNGIFNETDLFEKMRDKEVQKKVPEIGYIIDNLIPAPDFNNKGKIDLNHSFFISFMNPLVHIRKNIRIEKRVPIEGTDESMIVYDYVQREETKNNQKAIERKGSSRFHSYSEETTDPFIRRMMDLGVIRKEGNKTVITEAFADYYPKLNFKRVEDRNNFLKLLGYEVINIEPREIKKGKEFDNLTESIRKVALALYQRTKEGKLIEDPISELKKDDIVYDRYADKQTKLVGERENIRNITNFISKYSLEDSTMSYNGPNGKLRYAPVKPTKITTTNFILSTADSFEEVIDPSQTFGFNFEYMDVNKYAHVRGSYFLRLMFGKTAYDNLEEHPRVVDSNNEPVKILIESYVGYDKQNEKGAVVESTDSDKISDRDKLIAHINSLISSGRIPMLRPGSKKTELSMAMSTYNPRGTVESNLPISIRRVKDTSNPYALVDFVNIANGYVEAELFKIGSPDYQKAGRDKFVFFENVFNKITLANGKNLEEVLMKEAKEVKDGNYMAIVEKYQSDIQKGIEKFLKTHKEKLREKLNLFNIVENDFSYTIRKVIGLPFEKILDAFVINNFILKVEEIKLFRNDLSLYKDAFKRIGQDVSNGTLAIPSEGIVNYLYQTRFFNLATGVAETAPSMSDMSKLSFVTVADQVESESPIVTKVGRGNKLNFLASSTEHPKIISDAMYSYAELYRMSTGKEIDVNDPDFIEMIKSEFMPVDDKGKVGGYGKINVTDGGARITLDAYRKARMAVQNWDDAEESLYRAISLEQKIKRKMYEKTENPEATKEKWKNDMDMYYDLAGDAVFSIAKFQINVTIVRDGVEHSILHKCSLSPIIPEVIESNDMETIHEEMLRKGIDYIPFESASKVSTINLLNLFEAGLNKTNIDPNFKISVELSSAKEQIVTQTKTKHDVSAGVQMQQIAFQDLIVNGKPIDFPGTVEEFESTPDAQLGKISLSYRMFLRAQNKIATTLRNELLNDLGIVFENGNYTIKNAKKLVEKLHSLAENKRASINVLDYIAYDDVTKGLANPLDFSMTSDDIKKMINGLLDKKLRRVRLYGSTSVQDSDFGFGRKNHSFTNPTQEQLLEYGSNGLPFYYLKKTKDGIIVSKMGVAITMTGDYNHLYNITHLDGSKVGTLKRLNECLENKAWREAHEDALTIVGYRTPTQGKNAMDVMVIHRFLPEMTGNTIILPAGITTKSGTDYDIDKMSLYFKHLDYNGNVIDVIDSFTETSLKQKLEELKKYLVDNYEDFEKAKASYKEVKKEMKVIEQEIEELTSELMEDEEDEQGYEDPEKIKRKKQLQSEYKKLKREVKRNSNPKIAKYYSVLNEVKSIKKVLNPKVQAQNEMVKALEIALSSPVTFYSLTKPNSSAKLESLSKVIGEKTGKQTRKFKNSELLDYLSSWEVGNQVSEAKAGLSGWAANITFAQNLIAANFKLSNILRFTASGKPVYVNNPLLTSEQERRATNGQEGTYDLGSLYMLDGKTLVSSDFVESSTMTVDAENNPFANTLGLSSWNNWIAIYLTLKRVPKESIWAFLNQPILVELYNRLNVQGFVNKNYVIAQLIAEYFPEFVPVEHRSALSKRKARKLIAYLQSIVLSDKFRQKTLMDALSPNAYSGNKNKNSKTFQFHILTYFVQADQEAKVLQKLRKNTNFPSRKITSILEVNSIHETNRFLLRSPFLGSTKNYFNRALSMSYDSLDIFKAVYSAMFPISSYSEIARLFIKNENKYVDEEESNPFAPQKNVWTDVQKSKAEKILTNDVMFGILQNFGFPFGNIAKNVRLGEIALGPSDTVLITGKKGAYIIQERTEDGYKLVSLDGISTTAKFNEVTPIETFKLANDVKHRVWNGKGGRPIIDDILKLKDKYPELEELFPILKRFNANIDSKDKRYVNVELFRQNANEKPDKDSYITQLKALANHNNFEISGVFSELMLVAFYQAGYNMSPLYFTDLLDTNNSLSRMIHSANSTFLRLKEDAPELADLFLKELAKKIRLNNPNFYYYKTDKDTGQFLEKVNFKYHRGKDYSINMNDLALQLLENKLLAKIEGVDTQSDPIIKFGETAVQDFISGKKKSIISKTVYKDGVYSLNGSKEKIKVFLLGEANYQLSEGKDVIIVSGKINSPNIKTAVYDEDLDLSIIDLESFAKANGYKSFKEMKDTSIVLKTSLEEGSSFNIYDAIYVKLNEQSASFPGLKIVRNALTREEQLELFDYLKPIIEKSAAVTNKAVDANIMLGLGLRWDYKSNNPKLTPVPVGRTIRGRNAAYAYYNQDINGKPLEPISDRLKELVTKATGIDVSAYDGAIINIYTPNTHIGNHADEDESDTAIKYPVVAVNIGGNGNFNIGDDKTKKTFYDLPDGTGYAFGINGVNRRAPHFTQASPIEGFLPALHINHEKADIKLEKGSYRITITLRRVMPIQKSSPVVQTSTRVVTQAPKEGTLEQVIDSLSKSKSTKVGNSMIYTSNGKIFVSFKKEANLKVNLEFSTAEKAYEFALNVDNYKSYAAKRDFAKKVENGDVKPSSVVTVENPTSEPTPEEKIVRTLSTRENPINIYSDGSDIKGTGKLGFGAVYIYNGTEYYLTGTEEGQDVKDLMDKFPDMKFSNPTMEMLALARSLESFSETGEHIVINQDYKGAVNYDGLWQHAEESTQRDAKPWKAKEKYISYLVDRSVAAIKRIEDNGGSVKINWVKGHAGDKMNELADKYAKDRRNESTFTTPLVPVEIENNFVSSDPNDIDTGEIDPDDFLDVSVTEEYIGEDAPYDPTQDPYFGYSAESETNFQNPDEEGNTNAEDFEC